MQNNKKVIIFGNNNFAKLIKYYISEYSSYKVIGFCVDENYINEKTIDNLPVIPFNSDLQNKYPKNEYSFIVAVGYTNLNKIREEKYNILKKMGYEFISFIHPSAIVDKSATIEENCIILENSIVQPFAKVEANTIIWANATICHDSIIGKNCFIASATCINGFVKIEKNCFIGANATIRDNITIVSNSLIGAGCTILEDIKTPSGYKAGKNIEIKNDSKV